MPFFDRHERPMRISQILIEAAVLAGVAVTTGFWPLIGQADAADAKQPTRKPNIVVIVADDND
jgi:hypothetical protein